MAGKFSIKTTFVGVDRISATIKKISGSATAFSRKLNKDLKVLDAGLGKVHSSISSVGKAIAGVAAGAGAGLVFLGKAGADFEHTLAALNAVAQPTADELREISKTALKVGADFGISGVEVASAMEAMSKQGLTAREVIQGISGVAAAAAADGSSLEETMGGLLATMAGLGKGAGDLQHIADVMAKAGDATAASIGSLTQSMSVFGPTARQLGISVEDAVGQLALLQDAGIDASSAGTTLSAVYSKLAAPTKRTSDELHKLGISVTDSFKNMKPPAQLMNEIFQATQKIEGNAGKAAAITRLVGLESQKALLNIAAGVGSGKFDTIMKDLKSNVDGYSESVARMKMDSTTGDLLKLKAAFEALQIEIFGLVSKDLRDLIEKFTKWIELNKDEAINKIKEGMAWLKDNLPEIVDWMEKIGKALAVFYAYSAAVKVATAATAAFNAVMGVLNGTIALNPFVVWITALTVAIGLIWIFWPEISEFFKKVWETVTEWLSNIWNKAKEFGTKIKDTLLGFFDPIVEGIKEKFNAIKEFLVGVFVVLTFPLRMIFLGLKTVIEKVAGVLLQVWEPIKEWFAGLWDTVKDKASGFWDSVMEFADIAKGKIMAVWEPIKEFFTGLWDGISEAISSAADKVKEVWEPIGEFFTGLWNGIADAFKSALGWVIEKFQWLVDKGSELVGGTRDIGRAALSGDTANSFDNVILSPQERVARSISESHSTTSAEVTIRDQTGRAQVTQPPSGPGISLNLQPTGAF